MSKKLALLFLLTSLAQAADGRLPVGFLKNKPKLVVVLVVDQFRADYLTRYGHKLLPAKSAKGLGGYRYLMEEGAWFPQAEFSILQNMTGPGHATILTGSYPYLSGIPINEWYDSEKKKGVYCTEDSSFDWLSGTKGGKIGTSPRLLQGTTLGDELKNTSPKSKVVSISLKDRSAILMGGHRADAAAWMDPSRTTWTSSKFYFKEGSLPPWLQKANEAFDKKRLELIPRAAGLDSLIPQGLHWGDSFVPSTPAGLTLTQELVDNAIDAYQLGKGESTDLLAVSFSSHDYAGHTYGPNSPNMEAMTSSEDVLLSRFFTQLNKKIPGGIQNVLIVLTADHGVAPNPEWAQSVKIDAGRIDETKLKQDLEAHLADKLGSGKWVHEIKEMNVYLNPQGVEEKGRERVESLVKNWLLQQRGISHVFTSTEFSQRRLPPGLLQTQILNSYFPGRSGDVVAILRPYYVSGDETATHQTGWSYDRTVPLLIAGRHVRPGIYASRAEIVDIAPTLAFLIGILPPSQSHGRVLAEILGK